MPSCLPCRATPNRTEQGQDHQQERLRPNHRRSIAVAGVAAQPMPEALSHQTTDAEARRSNQQNGQANSKQASS